MLTGPNGSLENRWLNLSLATALKPYSCCYQSQLDLVPVVGRWEDVLSCYFSLSASSVVSTLDATMH